MRVSGGLRTGAGLLICLLALGGCSLFVSPPSPTATGTNPPDAGAVEPAFTRSGRFALGLETFAPAPDGEALQAAQGGFVWVDDGDTLRVDFTSPLGATLARLHLTAQQAWLQTAEQHTEQRAEQHTEQQGQQQEPPRIRTAPTAEDLVAQVLGVALPVTPLRHWLRGRATDADAVQNDKQPDVQRDPQGRLTRFVEHGWRVSLSRYDTRGPRLLRLERSTAQHLLKVRLAADAD